MKQREVTGDKDDGVRIDKWLWAVRFYKTRSLAHDAIEAGRVFVDDIQAKPSRKVAVGQLLRIRTDRGEYVITVERLVAQRVSAAIAQTLYTESEQSRRAREEAAELRKLSRIDAPEERPNTQNRRLLRRLKEGS
jgi:ribosome-associated heat shock protein Hsp15